MEPKEIRKLQPWQVLSLEFVEELNRESGKKWLQPYRPMPDDFWDYRRNTETHPITFFREINLKDGRIAIINRSAEMVLFTDGSTRLDPSMTCWLEGKVVGFIGDSFGATELFVIDSLHQHGIGAQLYKAYLENFGVWKCAGGFTASGFKTAQATHRLFVEEALAAGKPVPPEVLDEYNHPGGDGRPRLQRRPRLLEFHGVTASEFDELTETFGSAYDPFREVSADVIGWTLERKPWAVGSLQRNIRFAREAELVQVDLQTDFGEVGVHFADKASLWARFANGSTQTDYRFDLVLYFYGEVDERWSVVVRAIFQRRTVRELVFRSLDRYPAESIAA